MLRLMVSPGCRDLRRLLFYFAMLCLVLARAAVPEFAPLRILADLAVAGYFYFAFAVGFGRALRDRRPVQGPPAGLEDTGRERLN